jgi:hypothetical protein
MDSILNFNIPLTITELATLLRRQLPEKDRYELVEMLQNDGEPTKQQLKVEMKQAIKELNLVKQGKLKARPIEDLLNEI